MCGSIECISVAFALAVGCARHASNVALRVRPYLALDSQRSAKDQILKSQGPKSREGESHFKTFERPHSRVELHRQLAYAFPLRVTQSQHYNMGIVLHATMRLSR
eukprot:6390532-Amphidinium_carterae.1